MRRARLRGGDMHRKKKESHTCVSMQHRTQHTAHNTQHTAHNTQHTAHRIIHRRTNEQQYAEADSSLLSSPTIG